MTNNEILQSDILDILFENRNKDYGAYALRRGYNHRMLVATAVAVILIILFAFIGASAGKSNSTIPATKIERIVEIKEVRIEKEKPKEPDKPKQPEKQKAPLKPVQKIATQKFTSVVQIKPDKEVKEKMPDIAKLDNSKISDQTSPGKKDDGIPKEKENTAISGGGTGTVTTETETVFKPQEKDPEFPGGPDALRKFLASNLQTPGELEDGEKKVVKIRFKVDKDGSVNTFEIITSGGNDYDKEVVRVCKKMPHWVPAIQNGTNVPVSYVLPVTFIGVEQ